MSIIFSPLDDPERYDGDFECSLLTVIEKQPTVETPLETWIEEDSVSEEKIQADHMEGPVDISLQRSRRNILTERFGRSLIGVEEAGVEREYLLQLKPESCLNEHVYQCELEPKTASKECPLGWLHFQNRCYKYYEENTEWYEAKARCQQEGAQLVVLDSKQEQAKTVLSRVDKFDVNYPCSTLFTHEIPSKVLEASVEITSNMDK